MGIVEKFSTRGMAYRKNTKRNTTKTQSETPQKHKAECHKNTKQALYVVDS